MERSGTSPWPGGRGLVALPPGETVEGPVAFDDGCFGRVDRHLTAGRCPHGWLEIEAPGQRLLCLVRDSTPLVAGLVEESRWSRRPLRELPDRARQLEAASWRLAAADETLTRMLAAHFGGRPALRSSTRLVDPADVLQALAEAGGDAVLAFERAGARTLMWLAGGRPERIYFADPADDPGAVEGDLADRLLASIFRVGAAPGVIEVFSDLELLPDADAGVELTDLAAVGEPPPATTISVTLGEGRELLHRPFTAPEVVIGRDPSCEIFLDNLAVSRRHARIVWSRGRFLLEDLESANGTRLNGTRVRSVPLGVSDRIEIGKFTIQLAPQGGAPGLSETMLLSTAPARARLALRDGAREVPLDRGAVIGRGRGVDVTARGWSVRPVHARVDPRGQVAELTCFGRARVRVSGRRVRTARLEVGDRVRVGRTELELVRL